MRTINQDKQPLPSQSTHRLGQKSESQGSRIVSGLVTSILDGNTFIMNVQSDNDVQRTDKYVETIRIFGLDKPATSTLSGILAKLELEKKIAGRIVECEILSRDESGQFAAKLPKQYLVPPFLLDSDN